MEKIGEVRAWNHARTTKLTKSITARVGEQLERKDRLTKALSYLRDVYANVIILFRTMRLSWITLESCTYLRIGFSKEICISVEWARITRVSLCFRPMYLSRLIQFFDSLILNLRKSFFRSNDWHSRLYNPCVASFRDFIKQPQI